MLSIPNCGTCNGDGLCTQCAGTGRVECERCDGGQVPITYWHEEYDAPYDTWDDCHFCGGTGQVRCDACFGSGLCDECNGSGEQEVAS